MAKKPKPPPPISKKQSKQYDREVAERMLALKREAEKQGGGR